MPEIDGFEGAREIRRGRSQGEHYLFLTKATMFGSLRLSKTMVSDANTGELQRIGRDYQESGNAPYLRRPPRYPSHRHGKQAPIIDLPWTEKFEGEHHFRAEDNDGAAEIIISPDDGLKGGRCLVMDNGNGNQESWKVQVKRIGYCNSCSYNTNTFAASLHIKREIIHPHRQNQIRRLPTIGEPLHLPPHKDGQLHDLNLPILAYIRGQPPPQPFKDGVRKIPMPHHVTLPGDLIPRTGGEDRDIAVRPPLQHLGNIRPARIAGVQEHHPPRIHLPQHIIHIRPLEH